MSSVELTDNLTLVVKGGAAQLSPSQCFRLAEKCLRGATKAIVRAEAQANGPVQPGRDGRNG
jgi:hypothetical protein